MTHSGTGTVTFRASGKQEGRNFFAFFPCIRPLDIGQGASCRQEAGCGASEIFRMGVHLCLVYPDTWLV